MSGDKDFLTFIDDKTRYTWIYVLNHRSHVFETFPEWKALIDKFTGETLKALRTDIGGEYTSAEFHNYTKEGIRHERTIPKKPEQNGVVERMNRTLVESVRSMLADNNLSHTFWEEQLYICETGAQQRPSMVRRLMKHSLVRNLMIADAWLLGFRTCSQG